MVLVEAWKTVVLKRYAKFEGRAGRAEFWWYALANIVLNVALGILWSIGFAIATGLGVVVAVLTVALYLALIVPSIAVEIRRLHDTDKSGWFLLIGLIPIVGFIILLVFYIQEGTAGPNQFGAGPEPAAG